MTESVSAIVEPISFLCLGATFVILFVTVLKTLKTTSFFEGKTAGLIALCVTLLCVVGLHQTFLGTGGTKEIPDEVSVETPTQIGGNGDRLGLKLFFLTYTALAIAILSLLLFTAKMFQGEKINTPKKRGSEFQNRSLVKNQMKRDVSRNDDRKWPEGPKVFADFMTPAALPDGNGGLTPCPELLTEEKLIIFLRIPEITNSKDYHNAVENLKGLRNLPRIHICNKTL